MFIFETVKVGTHAPAFLDYLIASVCNYIITKKAVVKTAFRVIRTGFKPVTF